ncbi:MAG: ComF family protein [Phaeodactylibacter sp.]|nr:ComF family protein [Phaeodactylibacter sp.]MCB9276357.1 ComF family protein [Lewinellaceae bacterium]
MPSAASSFRWAYNLTGLFFPNLCLACGKGLPPREEAICLSCQYKLPKTGFHLHLQNPFTERFWGRVNIQAGAALYHFTKGGRTQRLIHNLKYEGKREIGLKLGLLYGQQLRDAPGFHGATLILPVPLHPRKERLRGYNQSAAFAQGLSSGMGVPWLKDGMKRREFTSTQTQKTRLERFDNVSEAFVVPHPHKVEGQHVLLADDVITTGATLEACALKVLELPGTKVSLATIAIAE